MFIPGALHGIEASFLADAILRNLHTATFKVVWPDRQPLANVGAVLSLLDGPQMCDPAFCVVWFRFRISGTVLFLLWLRSVNILSFMVSWRWTSLFGLRCLLWRVWLPLLSGANGGSPWAENPAEGAGNLLEYALGSCTSGLHPEWQLPVGFDPGGAVERVAAEPDVWTDGGLVQDKVSGASSSGSGFFTHHPGRLWAHRRWGHLR